MACKSILVVDDENDVRETLKDVLEMEGYTVHVAANGKEAIDVLSKIDRPCLILLDLMMPVMNGWDFLEKRKKDDILAQIPVAVVSAAGRPFDIRGKKTTAMPKPVDLEALIAMVASFCPRQIEQSSGEKQAA